MSAIDLRSSMSERRVTLLCSMLAALGPLSLALFTPAMPLLGEVFKTTDTMIKATLSVYFFGFAMAQLMSGPLSDRFGRKSVIIWFLAIFLIGSIGTLVAPSIDLLIWSRLLQGIGAASGLVMSRAIVRDLFMGDTSARVLNITSMIIGVGPTIAPVIGGAALLLAGWHGPFILMLVLGASSMIVVHFGLIETRPEVIEVTTFKRAAKNYGIILNTPNFFWSSLTIGGAVGTFYAQSAALAFIVMGQLGYSAAQFGTIMAFAAGGYFFGSLIVRQLIPRFGSLRLVPVGLAMLCTTTLVLACLQFTFGPTLANITIPVAMMSMANAFIMPAMYTTCLSTFPDKAGSAAAMSGFMTMGLGLLASVAISLIPNAAHGLVIVDLVLAGISATGYIMWRRQAAPSYGDPMA